MNDLYLIAVNLTRRCNLACAHCYMDAETRDKGGETELSTAEVHGLLEQIARRSNDTMVVLTGGEPLLRQDLETVVAHGHGLGLSLVVGSNGVLLSERRAASLQAAGVMGIGISLDSLDPGVHDIFRGSPGSWEKTLAGMEHCRTLGLPFQIHFSVTEGNAHEVQGMIDFARASGAHVLNFFFLICTGRGESMSDISPASYERVLETLVAAQMQSQDLVIRARCAPHFKRVAFQQAPDLPVTRVHGYEGGGCLAGIHYCRITPEGAVTACPYIPDEEGSIRNQGFWQIWDDSERFAQLRGPSLNGACGRCEFRKLCGGCRARPLALGSTLMDADPWCEHTPSGQPVIEPLSAEKESGVGWSPEAEQRLARVPGFLRKMVRGRAEAYVLEQGERQVTPEHMAALAARRFGDKMPGGPSAPPVASNDHDAAGSSGELVWTAEADEYLRQVPGFLQAAVRQVAEDVARDEGRLEVNMRLLRRLEEDDQPSLGLPWAPAAEQRLTDSLAGRPAPAMLFVRPSMEQAAAREAKRRGAKLVEVVDVERVLSTDLAGVEWAPEALARVESAPDFVRGGIKKAAEFAARREGVQRITSEHLTRFRNRAMMKAVRRMKGFGLQELSFDAYAIAKERVPRLQDNQQAEKRFTQIRAYVESRQSSDGGGLGLLDRSLLERMKAELKR